MQQPSLSAHQATIEDILLDPARARADERPILATMLGADFSARSVTTTNADRGPGHIRRVLREHSPCDLMRGLDLTKYVVSDHGDAHSFNNSWESAWTEIITHARTASTESPFVIALGGDQSVTWPLVTVAAERATRLGVFHIDAQRDMCELGPGVTDRNVMRGLVEHQLVRGTDLVQVALNRFANDAKLEAVAHANSIVGVTVEQLRADGITPAIERALWSMRECDAIWLSVDIECLDRTFAPGSTNAFAGGLLPAELDVIVDQVCGYPACVGMDVVEFDPSLDVSDITAHHAARVVMVALAARAARHEPATIAR